MYDAPVSIQKNTRFSVVVPHPCVWWCPAEAGLSETPSCPAQKHSKLDPAVQGPSLKGKGGEK